MKCPRCGGFVARGRDYHGSWDECIMCGWVREDSDSLDIDAERAMGVKRRDSVARRAPVPADDFAERQERVRRAFEDVRACGT